MIFSSNYAVAQKFEPGLNFLLLLPTQGWLGVGNRYFDVAKRVVATLELLSEGPNMNLNWLINAVQY